MQISEADVRRSRMINKILIPPVTDPVSLKRLNLNLNFRAWDMSTVSKKMHHHSAYEVHYIMNGSMTYRFEDGEILTVREREFLFIPPGKKHIVEEFSENCIRFSMVYEYIEKEDEKITLYFPRNPIKGNVTEETENIFAMLLRIPEYGDKYVPYRIRDLISHLIFSLADDSEKTDEDDGEIPKADLRIMRAKQYIIDNCSRSITVGELASYVHLSPRQLERLFKIKEGGSIFRYIQQERCNMAKNLLLESDMSFSDIADYLDFSNEYNFIRFFKKSEGITPKKFQECYKKYV